MNRALKSFIISITVVIGLWSHVQAINFAGVRTLGGAVVHHINQLSFGNALLAGGILGCTYFGLKSTEKLYKEEVESSGRGGGGWPGFPNPIALARHGWWMLLAGANKVGQIGCVAASAVCFLKAGQRAVNKIASTRITMG